jgi:hypothetical protein
MTQRVAVDRVAVPPDGDTAHLDTATASCWGYGLVRVRPLAEELHCDAP